MATIAEIVTRDRGRDPVTRPAIVPPPPIRRGLLPASTSPDDGDDSFGVWIEAEEALLKDAECAEGCDWPDGPLAAGGCLW